MINGAHAIIFSKNGDADRAFLRDVLQLPSVDVGRGWLIFGLPPSEVAVHPSENDSVHELYLMCDDIAVFVEAMTKQGIVCSLVADQGWGLVTRLTLPGGGNIGVYEPRHARPSPMSTPTQVVPSKPKRAASKKEKAPVAKKTQASAAKAAPSRSPAGKKPATSANKKAPKPAVEKAKKRAR